MREWEFDHFYCIFYIFHQQEKLLVLLHIRVQYAMCSLRQLLKAYEKCKNICM